MRPTSLVGSQDVLAGTIPRAHPQRATATRVQGRSSWPPEALLIWNHGTPRTSDCGPTWRALLSITPALHSLRSGEGESSTPVAQSERPWFSTVPRRKRLPRGQRPAGPGLGRGVRPDDPIARLRRLRQANALRLNSSMNQHHGRTPKAGRPAQHPSRNPSCHGHLGPGRSPGYCLSFPSIQSGTLTAAAPSCIAGASAYCVAGGAAGGCGRAAAGGANATTGGTCV